MSATATTLDHLGIAGPVLAKLAETYAALGFTLTPTARHSGRITPDGPVVPFATGNRCIMLREGYLELIATIDASLPGNSLGRYLARYHGLHILALGMDDEAANLDRLRRAGIDIPGIAWLQRPVDDADPTGPQAKFGRLPLPEAPEGKLQLIRHHTPEALWQERFLTHANNIVALDGVVLAAADPADSTARLSRLAGLPATPDKAGGYVLTLPRGQVRVLPPAAFAAELPGVDIPALPFMGAIHLRSSDGGAAMAAILHGLGDPATRLPAGLLVPPSLAGGAALLVS